MRANTAKDRIMTYLNVFFGESYSNSELANALSLPSASVRRTINELRAAGSVIADIGNSDARNTRWMAA